MTAEDGFLERMAQRLSATANAATVFGQPIERGDVTVVPVARAAYGFGGGRGTRTGEEGSGGGGGVRVSSVGFFEIRPGVVHYRPIRDWAVWTPVLVAGGVLTALMAARSIVLARRR